MPSLTHKFKIANHGYRVIRFRELISWHALEQVLIVFSACSSLPK